MTIQNTFRVDKDSYVNHVCYVANQDSGYFCYPFVKTKNGRVSSNMNTTRLNFPQAIQQNTFYIRKLQYKTVTVRYKKEFVDWVCSVEIPFSSQEEDKNSLGSCYMPLFANIHYSFSGAMITDKNGISVRKGLEERTIQPSALGTVVRDILWKYFDCRELIYHIKTLNEKSHLFTYSRCELDIESLFI